MQTLEVQLEDELIEGEEPESLSAKCREGHIILRYLDGKISIGKVAELMKMRISETHDWLHKRGISTLRKFPPHLEADAKENAQRLKERILANA